MRTPRVTAGGVLVHGFVNRERLRFTLRDLTLSTTVGTGTFGRVRIAQHVETNRWYALKILKKSEIVRLQQLEHIKNEVRSNGGGRERKVLSRSRAHATPYYPLPHTGRYFAHYFPPFYRKPFWSHARRAASVHAPRIRAWCVA